MSDTHFTSGRARNIKGYFTFGNLSSFADVGKWYLEMAKKAIERMTNASYEVSHTLSNVKVMGSEQFSVYSNGLDRGMNITKASFVLTIALLVALVRAFSPWNCIHRSCCVSSALRGTAPIVPGTPRNAPPRNSSAR